MDLKVVGLDPGTLKMGYGVLFLKEGKIRYTASGCFSFSSKESMENRLYGIHNHLEKLFKKHRPQHTAIEQMFVGKNPSSAFKLGLVFGISVLSARKHGSKVFHYPPRLVKKTVSAGGGSDKNSVRFFVKNVLNIEENEMESLDASDALAVALCHIYHFQNQMGRVTF